MTLLGSPDLDSWSQDKPMNSRCISFETECTFQLKAAVNFMFCVRNTGLPVITADFDLSFN